MPLCSYCRSEIIKYGDHENFMGAYTCDKFDDSQILPDDIEGTEIPAETPSNPEPEKISQDGLKLKITIELENISDLLNIDKKAIIASKVENL